MEIIGYIASILIGISLGLTGSGGSILTVPVLVYLMNTNPLLATTNSLFIVGATSLAGGLRAYSKKLVDFKAAITGIAIGSRISDKIPGVFLKKGFGWFILVMGVYIIIKEMLLK
jgi:uncharacterized membrane protein YfcA